MTKYTALAHLPYPEVTEFVNPDQIGVGLSSAEVMLVVPFADTTDRTSKWGNPPQGAISYLNDTKKYQAFVGAAWIDLISAVGSHLHAQYVVAPVNGTDGVRKLYRSDASDGYHVTSQYEGARWRLSGRNPDGTLHAGCLVDRSDTSGRADSAAASDSSGGLTFHWSDPGGPQPVYVLCGSDPANIRVQSFGNSSVGYATSAGSAPAAGGTADNSNGLVGIPGGDFLRFNVAANISGAYDFTGSNGLRYSGKTNQSSFAANATIINSSPYHFTLFTSTRDVKDNIEDSGIDWHKLLNLRSKRWISTAEGDKGNTGYGFIAEEVEEQIPELAEKDGDGKTYNWNYVSVVTGLVELVNELFDRVQSLEATRA